MDSEVLDFINESQEALSTIEELVITLEKQPDDEQIVNAIFRPFHSLKGTAGFYGFDNIRQIAHKTETLLSGIRKRQIPVTDLVADSLLSAGDLLRQALVRLKADQSNVALLDEESIFIQSTEELIQQAGSDAGIFESMDLPLLFDSLRDTLVSRADESNEVFKSKTIQTMLDQMNEVLASLKDIDKDHAAGAKPDPGESYEFEGRDISEPIHNLKSAAFEVLAGPLPAQSLDSCKQAVASLKDILANHPNFLESLSQVEPLLTFLDDDLLSSEASFQNEFADKVHQVVDGLRSEDSVTIKKLGEILVDHGAVSKNEVNNALAGQKKLGQILVEQGKTTPKQVDKAIKEQKEQIVQASGGEQDEKYIRVSQDKIDHVVQQVADIVVFSESFNYWYKLVNEMITDRIVLERMYESIIGLEDLSRDLQEKVLSIRQVPMKQLFQKMPRMVRELSKSLGIDVDLQISGESISVDKNIVTFLEDPMVHMIRNALDHGLEKDPKARLDLGKSAKGQIRVSAEIVDDNLHVVIKDDGQGMSKEKIMKAAIEKELAAEAQAARMSDSEIFNYIFAPGFSTAEKVTDISGRGVGMDVVRSNIEHLKGRTLIESKPNLGTSFTIIVPLSQVLISQDALFFEAAEVLYTVPFEYVNTVLHFPVDQITGFTRRTLCVEHKNMPMELIPFESLLENDGQDRDVFEQFKQKKQDQVSVIVFEERGHSYGLIVDKVLAPQKIVLKPLEGVPKEGKELFAGISILGNGEMVLAASMKKIVQFIKGMAA